MLSIPEEIWEGGASESSAGGNGLSWKEIVIEDGTFNQLDKRYAAPGVRERGASGGGGQLVLSDRTEACETCAVTFQVLVYTMCVWVCCVCVCVYTYISTYIYIYVRMYIHTYIHTYIHVCCVWCVCGVCVCVCVCVCA